jgi:phosphoribosylformylglycinamidine (FGAM) synthase-like enzyme
VRTLVLDGALSGVHDVADGGLAKALAEMTARSGVGARVTYADAFGESAGRVIACVAPGVDIGGTEIGVAGGDRFVIDDAVDHSVEEIVRAYRDNLPSTMGAGATH